MDTTPQTGSRIHVIRVSSGGLAPSRPPIFYAPHRAADEPVGKSVEPTLGKSAADPTTHRPWNTRLGRWVVRQLKSEGQVSPATEVVASHTRPALSGMEEIGSLSRYAVEKFISTLALVQALPCGMETPGLSAAAWARPLARLSAEYQQAMLTALDESGRQITSALHTGQLPSSLADQGRSHMDQLSEHYINTCRTICQGRN